MNIAICDDEKFYLSHCQSIIENLFAKQEICFEYLIDCYTSGEQLIHACSFGKQYDLVYLDIKMQKLCGFDTAKGLRKLDEKALIIFLTSFQNYVFNSFEYQPFWFLNKPISEEKFNHVFKCAAQKILGDKNVMHSFYSRESGQVCLEINKIIYLESSLRKIIIHTSNDRYSYYGTLKEEMEKFKKHNFTRSHNAFLVNMSYINRIEKTEIVLKDSNRIPISEHKYKSVIDSFTRFVAGELL